MQASFYSNGKLLLSGEYAVLDGAKAWAIPTKFGQYLNLTRSDSELLKWKSYDANNRLWFEAIYEKSSLHEISTSDGKISGTLVKILSQARKMNAAFLNEPFGLNVETQLSFPRNWGLGSSSTLINNIASWAAIDAYQLLWNSFSGSGYDIACAAHDHPIVYSVQEGIPKVEEISGDLPFAHDLYFIYLNKKRNSRDAIVAYRKRTINRPLLIKTISDLTDKMTACTEIEIFKRLMNQHEQVLSKALGLPTVKEALFPDFQGSIKSLGAWGGDFVMATGVADTPRYFKEKGYETVLTFGEVLL